MKKKKTTTQKIIRRESALRATSAPSTSTWRSVMRNLEESIVEGSYFESGGYIQSDWKDLLGTRIAMERLSVAESLRRKDKRRRRGWTVVVGHEVR